MRLIGLLLSLAAIGWVLYQAAGGDEAETAVPVEYQRSVEKAQGLEQSLQAAADRQMQEADRKLREAGGGEAAQD